MKKKEKEIEEIRRCLKILDLPEQISIKNVKTRYRELSLLYHPDKNNGNNALMLELNISYKTIISFLESFVFDISDTKKQFYTEEELWEKKFGLDYLFEGARGKKKQDGKSE